jgi:Trk K+ transport system NAD-binding subunit
MDIGLPRGVLVVAVRRGEEFFVPSGEDAVEPGDRVVVVIAEELAGRLSEFL